MRRRRDQNSTRLIQTDDGTWPSTEHSVDDEPIKKDEEWDIDPFDDSIPICPEYRLDDYEGLEDVIATRLEQIQQVPCREITRLWITVAQPQKVKRHQYNGGTRARDMGILKDGGEFTKPDWWPWGMPHKEPAHSKKERM